jgi:prepilin peptidase CpaA
MLALPLCAVFVAAMALVIFTDLKWRIIPNWLVLGLLLAYPAGLFGLSLGSEFMLGGLIVAGILFVLCFLAFLKGWMGGGDAKLIPVIALWLGAALTPPFLIYATALGGLLTIAFIVLTKGRREADEPLVVPYGPALAVAALILFPGSQWAAAL